MIMMRASMSERTMLLLATTLVLGVMLAGPATAIRSLSDAPTSISSAEIIDISSIVGELEGLTELETPAATNESDSTRGRHLLQGCTDNFAYCASWAKYGFCAAQYVYNGQSVRDVVCRASCGTCTVNVCAKCSLSLAQGGCKCDNSCNCIPTPASEWQAQLLALLNQQRAKFGVSAVCLNTKLNNASQAQSNSGVYGHTWTYVFSTNYQWNGLGQNIAKGQATPEQVFSDWFNEVPPNDGHRKNILNADFNQMGLGWAQGSNMWTQNFGKSSTERCM